MLRTLILLLSLSSALCTASVEPDLLEPEQAFQLSTRAISPTELEVRFKIADGYYMYRSKFKFAADNDGIKAGQAQLPPGEIKHDEFFGKVETYRKNVVIRLPVEGPAERFTLAVTSQGCADIGVCYPPNTQKAEIVRAAFDGGARGDAWNRLQTPSAPSASPPTFGGREIGSEPPVISDESHFEQTLASGNFFLIVGVFFGAGILLAFTPCVLPMIPILSGIIVGDGRQVTRTRATILSVTYVFGMAVTYTLIGVLAALSGSLLSAALQNAWVLGSFALIFVVLAFSMFGFYDLQLPAFLQSRVMTASSQLEGGRLGAVAIMGMLSAAIVSPCVAAPLAGALLYISQTRDVMLGASALFAMALGMGMPLIAVGITEGALLPKSGHWMKAVKKFFGFLLLGVAIWVVSPLMPVWLQMLAWAGLLIISAMFVHALDPLPHDASGVARFWKGVGLIALLMGAALVLGALSGSRDVLQPLADSSAQAPMHFERVKTVAELDARLKASSQPVMLDFYADWCLACKEMERFTFSDPQVRAQLKRMLVLQADVTANSVEDQALLKRFRLFGPPGIIFFDTAGREITSLRVIGYQPPKRFQRTLSQLETMHTAQTF